LREAPRLCRGLHIVTHEIRRVARNYGFLRRLQTAFQFKFDLDQAWFTLFKKLLGFFMPQSNERHAETLRSRFQDPPASSACTGTSFVLLPCKTKSPCTLDRESFLRRIFPSPTLSGPKCFRVPPAFRETSCHFCGVASSFAALRSPRPTTFRPLACRSPGRRCRSPSLMQTFLESV